MSAAVAGGGDKWWRVRLHFHWHLMWAWQTDTDHRRTGGWLVWIGPIEISRTVLRTPQ